MKITYKHLLAGIIFLLFTAVQFGDLAAQNRYDALRYSLKYPGQDPSSLALPGASASSYQGSGSYVFNPATMALNKTGIFNGGLDIRRVSETVDYKNTTSDPNDQQIGISHFNFTYSFPTSQGSFIIGGGYHQLADFNRTSAANAYNQNSSIADHFNNENFYYDLAFNTYTVDYVDTTSQETVPFVRLANFDGIQQDVSVTERGKLGEWSAYVATEFQKDLFIGASIGLPSGSYEYERTFLETDTREIYEIRDMLSEDEISADISGFIGRLGVAYKLNELLQFGVSYTFQSTLEIEEEYTSSISTEFDTPDDDGNYTYSDELDGSVNYKITRPSRAVVGFTVTPNKKISISGTAEHVDYTSIDMDELDTRIEIDEKTLIEEEFMGVFNLMGGIEYSLSPEFSIKGGYALYPSARDDIDTGRQFISGGLSYGLWSDARFNLGIQYGTWKDERNLYNSPYSGSEIMSEEARRLRIMAGASLGF